MGGTTLTRKSQRLEMLGNAVVVLGSALAGRGSPRLTLFTRATVALVCLSLPPGVLRRPEDRGSK